MLNSSLLPFLHCFVVGKVNKQSPDHIGMLIYGVFNASISASNLEHEFEWNEQEQAWKRISNGTVVDNDSQIQFTIAKYVSYIVFQRERCVFVCDCL